MNFGMHELNESRLSPEALEITDKESACAVLSEDENLYESYGYKSKIGKTNLISNAYLKNLKKNPLLEKSEEHKLAMRVNEGDKSARDLMIKSNLRLVVNVAKKYLGRGLPFDDLIMEGNIGLIKAVDKFDPGKGFRFSTYAIWWIRQAIERGIMNSGRLIRLPIHISENLSRYYRASNELAAELEREPAFSEIAERMGINEKKLGSILNSISNVSSLDFYYSDGDGGDGNMAASNIIKDERGSSPFDILSELETLGLLNKWLLSLDYMEKNVITLRYGLNYEKPKTLNEIGLIFKLTKKRIRQIEIKAIDKLKKLTVEEKQEKILTNGRSLYNNVEVSLN